MSLNEFWRSQSLGPSSDDVSSQSQSLAAEADCDNELRQSHSDSLSTGSSLLADLDANSTTAGSHVGPSACPR